MRGWTEMIRPAHLTLFMDTSLHLCLAKAAVAQVAPSSGVVGSVEHLSGVVTGAIQECHDLLYGDHRLFFPLEMQGELGS